MHGVDPSKKKAYQGEPVYALCVLQMSSGRLPVVYLVLEFHESFDDEAPAEL
jgi:hypothetical protein